MLVFRKGEITNAGVSYKDADIRHQRTPDVIIDFDNKNKLIRGKSNRKYSR